MTRKIISIENLSSKVKAAKKQGKKIVHCHGVFDLLHVGPPMTVPPEIKKTKVCNKNTGLVHVN